MVRQQLSSLQASRVKLRLLQLQHFQFQPFFFPPAPAQLVQMKKEPKSPPKSAQAAQNGDRREDDEDVIIGLGHTDWVWS